MSINKDREKEGEKKKVRELFGPKRFIFQLLLRADAYGSRSLFQLTIMRRDGQQFLFVVVFFVSIVTHERRWGRSRVSLDTLRERC